MKNHPIIERILENIEQVMIGKREVAELSIIAMLAEGHVLLEDVPGVGKTMMVRSLAVSINGSFKRIQFTPDLLPTDVTGTNIYNPKELEFIFHPGPIMGNIILADEINRTSPKTQAALLEGMEEASVTVDGVTRKLEQPFLVMATQNPVDYEGTYPLPEAQLDRFLLKIKMGYPSVAEEIEVLNRAQYEHSIERLQPVISLEEVRALQQQVKEVHVEDMIKQYIVQLTNRTREHESVYLGVSPRGSIALMKASQAYALMKGRNYVIPDDIQYLASFVMAHRILLKPEAKYGGENAESIVKHLLSTIPVPIQGVMEKR